MWSSMSQNDQKPAAGWRRVIPARPKPRSKTGTRAMSSTW